MNEGCEFGVPLLATDTPKPKWSENLGGFQTPGEAGKQVSGCQPTAFGAAAATSKVPFVKLAVVLVVCGPRPSEATSAFWGAKTRVEGLLAGGAKRRTWQKRASVGPVSEKGVQKGEDEGGVVWKTHP